MEYRKSVHSVRASCAYTRDDTGRIQVDTQVNDHVTAYKYDNAYQLTQETRTGSSAYSIAYTYDAAGNRRTKAQNSVTENYAYGDNNQLLTAGSKSYAYDNNGSPTSLTVGTNVTTLA